jgi:hypothetical protein
MVVDADALCGVHSGKSDRAAARMLGESVVAKLSTDQLVLVGKRFGHLCTWVVFNSVPAGYVFAESVGAGRGQVSDAWVCWQLEGISPKTLGELTPLHLRLSVCADGS